MTVDVLMITHNRPTAVSRSLPRLLETCDESTRVWLWQNGDHEETLELVSTFAKDPRVAAFHHSRENQKLRPPTNWRWSQSQATYVSKVDDDCLVTPGWIYIIVTAN